MSNQSVNGSRIYPVNKIPEYAMKFKMNIFL